MCDCRGGHTSALVDRDRTGPGGVGATKSTTALAINPACSTMEGPLKEMAKLEALTSDTSRGKRKAPSVNDSLDSLLGSLREVKDRLHAGSASDETLVLLAQTVESRRREVVERQKDVYNSLARYNKALDKKFATPLPSYPPLFLSPEANTALERTIALHFLRTGQFNTAETFIEESGVSISEEMHGQFVDLHRIITALKQGNIAPALEWTEANQDFLLSRSSSLEFFLHRSQYMRLLLETQPADTSTALAYARHKFPLFYPQHQHEVRRLMACMVYLPVERLQASPYADLASPSLHHDLEPIFAKEYCASLGMSRQVPLRVVGDIGGGGALARIEKGRKVMRERKSEWSQSDELPIEISLPPENRYHSVFACPVSKEQSTEQNPPMMMACGHVIAKDSLQKLSKPGGRVKCPYCPMESQMSKDLLDESRSSTISIPELLGLSPEEVDFIDAVIERAPASATTFLTVFKAYNDILQERGLDPQNEVVYYGKLLKLGTLRGKNWGEKWLAIKQQQGYVGGTKTSGKRLTRVTRTTPAPTRITTRLTTGLKKPPSEDTFTLHSHPDDTDTVNTEAITESLVDTPQYHNTPRTARRPTSPTLTSTTNSLGLDTGPPSTSYQTNLTPRPLPTRRIIPAPVPARWDAETSEVTADTVRSPSTTPPSYGAATRDAPPHRTPYSALRPHAKAPFSRASSSSPPPFPTNPIHHVPPQTKERRKSAINEDDAWNKIKMVQDEKEADRFREDRLVERCWDVWKQGYQWIITTHDQIAHARDTLVLRLALHRWRQRTAARLALIQRVTALADARRLRLALHVWHGRLREKRQADWRAAMRAKMKTVRDARDVKLRRDAWAKWRQAHRAHLAAQHCAQQLVRRAMRRWRARVAALDGLDAAAEHFVYAKEERAVERCWDMWRRALEMQRAEKVMAERVGLRVMSEVVEVWKKRLHDTHVADEVHDKFIMRRAVGAWKAARDRIQTVERRASKHIARQDDVLVRAVMRVWKAHERGRLLERVKSARLLKQAWAVWKRRVRHQRGLEDLALAFSVRTSSTIGSDALQKWFKVFSTHRNAQAYALQYHAARLQYKMLLTWRLQLRAKLRMIKQAKIAQKYFMMRDCLNKWHKQLVQRRLEKKLREFESRLARKYFDDWLELAQRQRQRKIAEEIIRQRVAMRIMAYSLVRWTNRVADLKFRELDTAKKFERTVVASAFKKWKTLCIRHMEGLSLMESFLDVKREENVRRVFYRWLNAARKARHQRLYLQQKEEEMQLTVIAAAWDKWRERFQDLRLQPIADDFLNQHQKNTIFRAFGIWHSKTRSLPAVRFHAFNAKAKVWKIWREAMPRALQARTARETDRGSVLVKAFSKWHTAYKTKIELKAVARARYLRLPTAAPRQVLEYPRASTSSQVSRTAFPYRATQPRNPEAAAESSTAPPAPRPFSGRFGITSLLTSRPRSPERPGRRSTEIRASVSPSRPKLSTRGTATRASSPVRPSVYAASTHKSEAPRSTAGPGSSVGEPARSSLWQELRGIQIRSRPVSERSVPREPP
ncbi:Sfi1 spindle body protein-domain-containing protein [Amylocystis lapponica]|nr:Sfi1 spindle body protein-domain-containing protein [Amylocystis lapponica]